MKAKKLQNSFNLKQQSVKVAAGILALSFFAIPSTQAIEFDLGDWEGSIDTTLTVGASWRVEERDDDLVGKSNLYQIETGRSITELTGSGIVPPGAWSNNGDDGNLNFDKGDTFSQIFKGVTELSLHDENRDFGLFARVFYFYDAELEDGDRPFKELSGSALDEQGSDIRELDLYVYGTFEIGERLLQVRLGEQVINWGESTFIQHSISEANPIDIRALRAPGAELREAFIPVQTAWASFDINSALTLEAYVQFEWEYVQIDEPGTYFATRDFLGHTGEIVHLGFSQIPEGTVGTEARRVGSKDPSDSGQYGVKLAWYAEDIDTEFGFYYLNYHNKRPIISSFAHNGIEVQGFLEYPEDIRLLGISFNTSTDGGLSIAGEVSHRIDEPLQVDDVELLFATLEPIGLIPTGTSQIPGGAALGEEISGYRLFDTTQAQITFTNLFGPTFGASQFVGLLEVGANWIPDLPNENVLRFEAPGTARSGNLVRAGNGRFFLDPTGAGPCAPVQCEGVTENEFADSFSWGYRLVGRLEYTNAFLGMNVLPRIVFQHDVNGNTPAPISNFVEDRKAMALGVTFDYQSTWRADISYNRFYGAGTANGLQDRDYVALSLSYSF